MTVSPLENPEVLICPAKIHRLGRTCAAFPQCASSTLLLLTCLSFSSLLLTLQQPAKCKNFFDQETLSGCNTTIRARSFSMGPQRSSCEWGNVGDQSLHKGRDPLQTSRIHAAVGASTEPKGSLVWMTLTQNWDGKVHSSTMAMDVN